MPQAHIHAVLGRAGRSFAQPTRPAGSKLHTIRRAFVVQNANSLMALYPEPGKPLWAM